MQKKVYLCGLFYAVHCKKRYRIMEIWHAWCAIESKQISMNHTHNSMTLTHNCMKKYIQIAVLFFSLGIFSSCVTQKQMTYFRGVDATTADSVNRTFTAQIDPVVKSGDALFITVSALDMEAVAPYNLPTAAYSQPGSSQVQTTPSLQYYTVNAEGNIEFPVLGVVPVLGLKTTEVANLLEERLSSQVVNPMVIVQLINAKVTVMGEVNKPGQYVMTNGRMTLLDALGAAGDLSVYGKRENVLITRETNGKLEFHRLNLNSDELFTSPYYYLQQNDVIYVSPNKVRAINSTNVSLWLSMVSTVASAATVIVTVVNAAK